MGIVAMKHQQVRPSQAILSSSTGSIVDTPSGSVVMGSFGSIFNSAGKHPQEFEIVDRRLSQALGEGRIARLPSNAELGFEENHPICTSHRFPNWVTCKHDILAPASRPCPNCVAERIDKHDVGLRTVRFVQSCRKGHLDDVDWNYLVHRGSSCASRHFEFRGLGGNARVATVSCTACTRSANLGQELGRSHKCSGRFPETGDASAPCDSPARISPRGAASIYLADQISALTLSTLNDRFHDLFNQIDPFVELLKSVTPSMTLEACARSVLQTRHQTVVQQFGIERLVEEYVRSRDTTPQADLLQDEFRFLREAYDRAPIHDLSPEAGVPLFSLKRQFLQQVRCAVSGKDLMLRVAPISRLRVVMVNRGYRRGSDEDPDVSVVPTSWRHGSDSWFAGAELFGEGIYVDSGDTAIPLGGDRPASHAAITTHPPSGFVWWHTLAHRVIRTLAVDAGYSAASIRERIYWDEQRQLGGFLLYATQPGGDGTMGGLVEIGKQFGAVLRRSIQDATSCSNDPLCEEAGGHSRDVACFACTMNSETSCAHRNRGLDRLLLADNQPMPRDG